MRKAKHESKEYKDHKIEWSRVFCSIIAIGFGIYGLWCGVEYYALAKLAILSESGVYPDSTLAVTCVSVVLGSLLSYLLYQGALKTSLNRNKLTVDKATGIVRSIMEDDFLGSVEQSLEDEDSIEDEYIEEN